MQAISKIIQIFDFTRCRSTYKKRIITNTTWPLLRTKS